MRVLALIDLPLKGQNKSGHLLYDNQLTCTINSKIYF